MIPESPAPPPADPHLGNAGGIKIHNWADAGDEERINPDTRLVRYMKLETFLLLLDSRVFIPTLKTLQNGDRLEANLPAIWTAFYEEKMGPIVMPHREWLLNAAGNPVMHVFDETYRDISDLCLAAQCWRSALTMRRCVWCWNRSSEHFYFLWKIYGDRGMAVFSTVDRIRKVLSAAGAKGIVSPVRYVPPFDSEPRPDYDVLNKYFHRPHLFKDSGYRPEQEVRFVLKINPNELSGGAGAIVNMDPKAIIDKYEVSPHIFSGEKLAIQKLAFKQLWPSINMFPPGEEPRLSLMSPFSAEQDLPPGLFPDLDLSDTT